MDVRIEHGAGGAAAARPPPEAQPPPAPGDHFDSRSALAGAARVGLPAAAVLGTLFATGGLAAVPALLYTAAAAVTGAIFPGRRRVERQADVAAPVNGPPADGGAAAAPPPAAPLAEAIAIDASRRPAHPPAQPAAVVGDPLFPNGQRVESQAHGGAAAAPPPVEPPADIPVPAAAHRPGTLLPGVLAEEFYVEPPPNRLSKTQGVDRILGGMGDPIHPGATLINEGANLCAPHPYPPWLNDKPPDVLVRLDASHNPNNPDANIGTNFRLHSEVREGLLGADQSHLSTTNVRSCVALAIFRQSKDKVLLAHVNQYSDQGQLLRLIRSFSTPQDVADVRMWYGDTLDQRAKHSRSVTMAALREAGITDVKTFPIDKPSCAVFVHSDGSYALHGRLDARSGNRDQWYMENTSSPAAAAVPPSAEFQAAINRLANKSEAGAKGAAKWFHVSTTTADPETDPGLLALAALNHARPTTQDFRNVYGGGDCWAWATNYLILTHLRDNPQLMDSIPTPTSEAGRKYFAMIKEVADHKPTDDQIMSVVTSPQYAPSVLKFSQELAGLQATPQDLNPTGDQSHMNKLAKHFNVSFLHHDPTEYPNIGRLSPETTGEGTKLAKGVLFIAPKPGSQTGHYVILEHDNDQSQPAAGGGGAAAAPPPAST